MLSQCGCRGRGRRGNPVMGVGVSSGVGASAIAHSRVGTGVRASSSSSSRLSVEALHVLSSEGRSAHLTTVLGHDGRGGSNGHCVVPAVGRLRAVWMVTEQAHIAER